MFETDVLLKIYFVFLLIGFCGLLISLLAGGDEADGGLSDGDIDAGDTFDDSPKVFSLRVIFAFLMAFGIGAGSMNLGGNGVGGQILVGLLAGVGTAGITWWLTSVLYKMQGASNVNSDSFIGKTGDIVIGTTPAGKAKVRVSTISGPMELLCKEANSNKLRVGDLVRITGKMGTLLIVTKQ